MIRAQLERLARTQGYSVEERQQDIYYPAFGRTEHVTLLTVMHGGKQLMHINQARLEEWTSLELLASELEKRAGGTS